MENLKAFNYQFALDKARYNLTKYYTNKAESLCKVLGIGFADNPLASENYHEIVNEWNTVINNGGVIQVFSGASENTIFTHKHGNYAFRFWHDFLHVKHNLSFEHECEVLIGYMHVSEIEKEFGIDSLESKLIRADTIGQTDYYRKYRKFPDNQLEFCKAYIQILN
jgi:hypothetical protein